MQYYNKRFQGIILIFASLLFPLIMWGCSDKMSSTTGQTNPNPNPFNPVGTIQGKLADKVTLEPIAAAIVDIGVAKATTSDTGQFTMTGVPATQDAAKGTVSGSYSATIDLREVNKKIDAENKAIEAENAKLPQGSTPKPLKPKYPEFSYDTITVEFTSLKESETLDVAESQHDTPVDKLIANKDLSVGKLHANIEGVVAGCSGKDFFTPVSAGYTVKLYTAFSSSTTASGASGHLIGQTTTDASGKYSFSNVEAGLPVTIYAISADGTLENSSSVITPADGETLKLSDIQQSAALHVCSNDIHGPEIVLVTPEVGSDNSAGSINVELTFSEPVKQTAGTGTDPSGIDNLHDNIEVMFDGSKAGNVAYSLEWNSTLDKLTIKIPSTGTSSLYHVRLTNIDEVFADANGVSAVLGVCPDDSDVPSDYGIISDADDNDCTAYFTTKGGTTPGTPAVSLVNASSLDEDESTEMVLNWNPVSGAKTYNVYCTPIQVWGTTTQNDTTVLVDNVSDSQATVEVGSFVENGDVKLKYECFVRGVNSDSVEGPDSNKVIGEDTLGPELVDGDSLVCPDTDASTCDKDDMITDITLYFSELLNSDSAQTTTNYEIFVASGTVPTVTGAAYDSSGPSVKLTLSSPLDPANLNPSTIGPGDNGVLDSLDGSGNADGDDEVTRPDCVTAGTNGTLDGSTVAGDDEVVGTSINVGPDGVCDSTAAGDDTQALTVGNGKANSICITAGDNGWLETTPTLSSAGGDDAVSGTNILSGSNGVCDAPVIGPGTNGVINSTAAGDDVLVRPTCINPGADRYLQTSPSGDDTTVTNTTSGNSINVGVNGICDTAILGGSDDVQVLTQTKGTANSICVTPGANSILNTTPAGTDTVSGSNILSGTDTTCETTATADDIQNIVVGRSLNSLYITAGTNLVLTTTVAGDDVKTGEVAPDDNQNIPVGEGLNGTLISAGDNLVLDTTVDDEDVLVGGKAVTVSGVKDVGGTAIRTTADQYNTDGSVE